MGTGCPRLWIAHLSSTNSWRVAGHTMESILELTAEDLKQMGVSLPGHQKRILCSIQGFKEWSVIAFLNLKNAHPYQIITWNHSYGNCFQMSDWDKQSKTTRTEKVREATPPALISVPPCFSSTAAISSFQSSGLTNCFQPCLLQLTLCSAK